MPAIRHDDLLLRLVKEVNDIKAALRRVVVNLPLYDIANENTPAQLTADQNNYPPGNYDILRLSSSQAVNISGILGGVKGRSLRLFNDGDYPITLLHASLLSDAANRFRFSSGYPAVIAPHANTSVYYDASNSRWVDADRSSSGVVFVKLEKAGMTSLSQGVLTKISGFTVVDDFYQFYDNGTGIMTAKFSGIYHVVCKFEIYTVQDVNNVVAYSYIYKNSTEEENAALYVPYDADVWPMTLWLSTLIRLDEGDELEFYTKVVEDDYEIYDVSWRLARLG